MSDIAPDGSPVAFYRRLPATGEPDLIDGVIAPGASVLDLGCGPGRIAGPLAAVGHRVTGVDNGAAMIAALPAEVEGIVADAGSVRLGRRFGAVVMASHIINDPGSGLAFVGTAAAHLEPGGVVVAETYPPGWDPAPSVGVETRLGDARVTLLRATIDGGMVQAEVRYGVDDLEWQQSLTARLLDEGTLREMFAREASRSCAGSTGPAGSLPRPTTDCRGRRGRGHRTSCPPSWTLPQLTVDTAERWPSPLTERTTATSRPTRPSCPAATQRSRSDDQS